MKTSAEIRGLEHDWLATDATGHVALFSTAGGSFAPQAFLRDVDAHERAIDAILALRPSTVARCAPTLPPGLANTWREVAERGLFAYDGDVHGGPYRCVAAPDVPTHVDELPEQVRVIVQRCRIDLLAFAEHDLLTEQLLDVSFAVVQELIAHARRFHQALDRAWSKAARSPDAHRRLLGEAWGAVMVVDSSHYDYDFCHTFDFSCDGWVVSTVCISYVAPAFYVRHAVDRRRWPRLAPHLPALADEVEARVRTTLVHAGYHEMTRAQRAILVGAVALELSETDQVTLGKCLFHDA